MHRWRDHKEKLLALKELLESRELFGADVSVDLVLPDDPQFQLDREIPYLLVSFEVSERVTKERKIELFDYYLEKDLQELLKLITDMIEEFVAESESSEYGGG